MSQELHCKIAKMDLPYGGHVTDVEVWTGTYVGGTLAVQIMDDEGVWATLSVWLPESADLPEGWFYVKTWAENDGLAEALIGAGVLELDASKRVRTGFVEAVAGRLR